MTVLPFPTPSVRCIHVELAAARVAEAREAKAALAANHAREMAAIHEAACRWRKQGLVCSTCHELTARADRLTAATRPPSQPAWLDRGGM